MLTSIETGTAGSSQQAADGIPLCFAIASGLWQRGQLVLGHGLAGTEGVAATHCLAFVGAFTSTVDSPARSGTVDCHVPIDRLSRTAVAPSWFTNQPLSALNDASFTPNTRTLWQKRVISFCTLGDVVLAVVLRQRAPVSGELDPFWSGTLRAALFSAKASGLLDTLSQSFALMSVCSSGVVASQPRSACALEDPNPATQLVSVGARCT